jgi:hypothetical protein
MTGRQALRSITLAAVLSLAAYFFWQALSKVRRETPSSSSYPPSLPSFLAAGLFLGISFYTYIPARIMWVVFPAVLLLLAVAGHKYLIRIWWQVGLMLVVATVIGLPLFQYLANNPEVEDRLDQLNAPLIEAQNGNLQPLLENTLAGLKIIIFEGDHQWRYNIPGQPLLSPGMAILFVVGLVIAVWLLFRSKNLWQRAAVFFVLLWLLGGLSPVLVTGPELSTTQAIGIQPVLFIFPALALNWFLSRRKDDRLTLLVPVFFALLMAGTVNDYFNTWANYPQVRVQYESSLAEAIHYLNEEGSGIAAISTTTPDRFHSPAAGELLLKNPSVNLRWFNGRHSLIIPQGLSESILIFSGFAPLSPDLGQYMGGMQVETTIPTRETDLDRPITVYQLNGQSWLSENIDQFLNDIESPDGAAVPVHIGRAADFLGYHLQTPSVSPGQEVRLVTLWLAKAPLDDGVLFAQMLDEDGRPLAQSDRLDVPSYYWVPGDIFLQLHRFNVPEGVAEGQYTLITGLYTRGDEQRLPVLVGGGQVTDHLVLSPIEVGNE